MRSMATWTRGNGWVDIPYMEHVGVFPKNLLVSWVGDPPKMTQENTVKVENIQAVVFGGWMLKIMASNAFPIINWVQACQQTIATDKDVMMFGESKIILQNFKISKQTLVFALGTMFWTGGICGLFHVGSES